MNVQLSSFSELIKQEWHYLNIDGNSMETQLYLHAPDADITGGKIRICDIDTLAAYPQVKSVTISGLNQDTFEYFIRTYGRQLRYIYFFKNKLVADWSLLGTLPELEGVRWFSNQRITKLWDMRKNYALCAIFLLDFTRLHDLSGVETAPALEWFGFGDAVWPTSEIESLRPLLGTNVKCIEFSGKKIRDGDISFIPYMKDLEVFHFLPNDFTTEEVAWLVAKCPSLKGRSLKPYVDFTLYNEGTFQDGVPAVIIVGKRKPILPVMSNHKKIESYVQKFAKLVEQYRKE